MNRKKKNNQVLQKKLKNAKRKLQAATTERYISKAERAKLEAK